MGLFDKFKKSRQIDSNSILNELAECFSSYGGKKEEGKVIIPALDAAVELETYDVKEQTITLLYHVSSPSWDRSIFEVCSGIGKDVREALGMAQGSFVFALMDAVTRMQKNDTPEVFESEFAGNTHKWKLYIGNICGMGYGSDDKTADTDTRIYWNVLKEHIAKRIGNQKVCYVKVFASNTGDGNAIGEVRINNLRSEELSRIVEDMAAKWTNTGFASHKQFFLLKQEKETTIPYPYTEADIIRKTKWAMKIFEICLQEDKVEAYGDVLYSETKDDNLADELYDFIPEICAEPVIELPYPETVALNIKGKLQTYYKTQLYSYSIIYDTVFDTLQSDILQDPKEVRNGYIMSSSVASIANQLMEQGYQLEQLKDLKNLNFTIAYGMNDNYVPR